MRARSVIIASVVVASESVLLDSAAQSGASGLSAAAIISCPLAMQRAFGRAIGAASSSRRTCSRCPTRSSRRGYLFVPEIIHASPLRVGQPSLPSRVALRSSRRACVTGTRIEYSCAARFTGACCMETDQFLFMDSVTTNIERPNHMLQRTRPSHRCCNPRVPRAGSLSLGR
jgi:hypothetical protein